MSNSAEKAAKPSKFAELPKNAERSSDLGKPGLYCSTLPRKNVEEATSVKMTRPSEEKSKSPDNVSVEQCSLDRDKSAKVKLSKRLNEVAGKSVEKDVPMELTPPVVPTKENRPIPIIKRSLSSSIADPITVAVPRINSARPALPVAMTERPLVLATHLVPSLPIGLFEVLAEMIEIATGRAVVVLYEARAERPVATDVVDIAILPASENWEQGSLLPVSFVFEHRLNKDKSPGVYVDIVVAEDCVRNIEGILDLRGYRCALPDRKKTLGAAGLVFRHLKLKGESPAFFGNTLDSGSQLAALQMVAGKQAEVGVLESPVINCHRNNAHQVPGIQSLYVLESLGPLPPYRFMLNKKVQALDRDRIKEVLLGVEGDESRMKRLRTFGVSGFAEYSEDRYDLEDFKSITMSVPYY